MEDERMRDVDSLRELNLHQILEQFETFERVYPYYVNMLQDHSSLKTKAETMLKSTMKPQE